MSAASESYYWGKHRLASTLLLYTFQSDARRSSGLTALLEDRAMLGPVGRHTMPDLDAASVRSWVAESVAADAASIARATSRSLAAVQETQQ